MSEIAYKRTIEDVIVIREVIVSSVETRYDPCNPVPIVDINLCRMPSEEGDHTFSDGLRKSYLMNFHRELTEEDIEKIIDIFRKE